MNQQQVAIAPEAGVMAVLSRSEIDGQIATARQFPRDLELFQARAHKLATLNETVAAECLYSLPRDGKMIEGPSVRLAEILVQNWGNCRAGARIIEEGPEYVTAQGVYHDLETNAVTTFETRRRIVDKKGRRYSGDMITITCNAACAIALRQAVLKGIPKPYWEEILGAARARAAGDEKQLPQKRAKALRAFAAMGVDEARVLAAVGVRSVDEIGREEIATLQGLFTAIKDGESSVTDAFPLPEAPKPAGEKVTTIEQFAAKAEPQPAAEIEPADAYRLGEEAHHRHAARIQYPAGWKDRVLIEAWQAGWDRAEEEAKPS